MGEGEISADLRLPGAAFQKMTAASTSCASSGT